MKQAPMPQALEIRTLGALNVVRDGLTASLPASRKTRALLAYLVVTARTHRRERLCELLWEVPDDPRGSLRWSLAKIRRLVDDSGARRLITTRDTVLFEPHGAVVDTLELREALEGTAEALPQPRLAELAQLLHGEFLDGLDLPNCPGFQNWLVAQRDAVRALRRRVLKALPVAFSDDPESALVHVRALVDVDPRDEDAQLQLIRLLARTGRQREAREQHQVAMRLIEGPTPGAASRLALELRDIDGRRTQSVDETPVSARPRVIVLPFANLSGDAEQEYFSDAITQELITNLAKHRWLEVVARNTAFAYKGTKVELSRLVEDLGVTYVIEGSVRRAGTRIRATAQLVDALSRSQIWADRYDRELQDIFAVQDEITAKIAARLEPEIGASERQRVARTPKRDLRAWDCYHLGIAHFFRFTAEDNREAQRLLQKSRELDPDFGEAHAWWAYALILGMVYWDTEPTAELLDAALDATQRALQIDDQNAVFYALKGRVQLARCEYQSALMANKIAIDLNPTLAAAFCGLADSLAYEGRCDEAIRQFEHALELSPNDPQRWAFLTYGALAHIFSRDFETAIEWTDRASEIPNCQFWTYAHKAVALAYLGQTERARCEIDRVLKERPQFSRAFARSKLFYVKDPKQLDIYLEGLRRAGVPESR
jgi:TolB-like protein/Tfp pilus assembly protein PilF